MVPKKAPKCRNIGSPCLDKPVLAQWGGGGLLNPPWWVAKTMGNCNTACLGSAPAELPMIFLGLAQQLKTQFSGLEMGGKQRLVGLSRNPPPPAQIGEEIPTNRWTDFSAKQAPSECPGSQSQAPNTPSLWFLHSCSHVETQNISQFSKKIFRLSVCTWSLSSGIAVHSGGPVVYA